MPIERLKRLKSKVLPSGTFASNVLTLMTGTTIAQIIPIAVSPVLTRLYSPEQFGIFSVYMAVFVILSIVATGRYELALMLPGKDEDSANIAAFSVGLAFCVSCLTLLAAWMFNDGISGFLGAPDISIWLYLVSPMIFLFATYQVLSNWSNRKRQYRRLSISDITLKTTSEGAKLGMAQSAFGNGLIVGTVAGQAVATGVLGLQVWREDAAKFRKIDMRRMLGLCSLYRKFPIFNVPYSFIAAFSNEFIVFALTAFNFLDVAGFFGFTRRVVIGPISFLSSSLGRVFFQEASVSFGTPRLELLAGRLIGLITEFFTPVFVFFMFWAPQIFGYVFGDKWVEAGRYASVLAPSAFCFLYTSWPERIYEVAQKQQVSFMIQLVSDSVRVALIWGLFYMNVNPFFCIIAYSTASCIYHGVYLHAIFRIADFRLTITAVIMRILKIGAFTGVVLYAVNIVLDAQLHRFITGLIIVSLYYLWLGCGKFAGGKVAG